MKVKKVLTPKVTIRILLTLVLIFCVYRETGLFTAGSFLLVFITAELQSLINEALLDTLDPRSKDKNE